MQTESSTSLTLQAGNTVGQIGYEEAKEAFQKNSNWWTVFACFDLPDFKPSALWISKKTNIQVEEVVEALEGLVVIGFLKKENGSFTPIKGKDFIKFDWGNKTKAEIQEDHTTVTQQILNQMHPKTTVAWDHKFFAGNKEIIQELYDDIQLAFQKAFEKGQQNKVANDSIFKITFTGVDVLKFNENTQGEQ